MKALPPGERPDINTLRHLWELRVELEIKRVNGPWDSWDGRLIDKWLVDVKQLICEAESDLQSDIDARLEGRLKLF